MENQMKGSNIAKLLIRHYVMKISIVLQSLKQQRNHLSNLTNSKFSKS
jgi:hypothetical protein